MLFFILEKIFSLDNGNTPLSQSPHSPRIILVSKVDYM